MNRTPGLVNRGFCFASSYPHPGWGEFVRSAGASQGPRFRARQLRAAQQPDEPVKLAGVPAGTASRLPLLPRFAVYCDNPGHLPDGPNKLMVGTAA
jgi:hypothetical protein